MATTTIQYLALDNLYDPSFDPGASLSNAYAVGQALRTRLNLFQGEWWANLNIGLPMLQVMLGKSTSAKGLAAMQLAVQQVILGTPYVTAITSLDVKFSDITLQLSISAVVTTAFGQATVVTQLGTLASLGG